MAANLMRQLKNPWVMAALAAGGSYFVIDRMKPGFIYNDDKSLKNQMISPLTVSAGMAVALLAFMKMKGKGGGMSRSGMLMQQSMGGGSQGLYGPETFKV